MRNMLYGILCSAAVFALLSWATAKKEVHAAVLTAPPEGRFQLVRLHPSAALEWSAILDTETGCTWRITSNNLENPQIASAKLKRYLQGIGSPFLFQLLSFDTTDYTSPFTPDESGHPREDYTKASLEQIRVLAACSQARLRALSAASGQ